jgi:hypothetical protein
MFELNVINTEGKSMLPTIRQGEGDGSLTFRVKVLDFGERLKPAEFRAAGEIAVIVPPRGSLGSEREYAAKCANRVAELVLMLDEISSRREAFWLSVDVEDIIHNFEGSAFAEFHKVESSGDKMYENIAEAAVGFVQSRKSAARNVFIMINVPIDARLTEMNMVLMSVLERLKGIDVCYAVKFHEDSRQFNASAAILAGFDRKSYSEK